MVYFCLILKERKHIVQQFFDESVRLFFLPINTSFPVSIGSLSDRMKTYMNYCILSKVWKKFQAWSVYVYTFKCWFWFIVLMSPGWTETTTRRRHQWTGRHGGCHWGAAEDRKWRERYHHHGRGHGLTSGHQTCRPPSCLPVLSDDPGAQSGPRYPEQGNTLPVLVVMMKYNLVVGTGS